MDDSWQAAQYADDLAHEREVIEAILCAEAHGTPQEVIDLLAAECGVRSYFNNKEAR